MVQMNQTNPVTKTMLTSPSPALGRILSLGIKPIPDLPTMLVSTPEAQIGVMPNGKVSLFFNGEYKACECSGTSVGALPTGARLVVKLRYDDQSIAIYRTFDHWFLKRQGVVTRLDSVPVASEEDGDTIDTCKFHHGWDEDESEDDDGQGSIPQTRD